MCVTAGRGLQLEPVTLILTAFGLPGNSLAPLPCNNLISVLAVGAIRKFLWGLELCCLSWGAGRAAGVLLILLLLLMDPSDLLWEDRGEDHSFLKGSKADAQKCFKLLCLDALNSPISLCLWL